MPQPSSNSAAEVAANAVRAALPDSIASAFAENGLLVLVFAAIFAVLGAFIGAYAKERGRGRAAEAGFDAVRAQQADLVELAEQQKMATAEALRRIDHNHALAMRELDAGARLRAFQREEVAAHREALFSAVVEALALSDACQRTAWVRADHRATDLMRMLSLLAQIRLRIMSLAGLGVLAQEAADALRAKTGQLARAWGELEALIALGQEGDPLKAGRATGAVASAGAQLAEEVATMSRHLVVPV